MNNIIETFSSIPAHIAYNRGINQEKRLGYKLVLNSLSSNWINGAMIADMTRTWRNYGLKVSGTNYFTIGNINNNFSSRFDKDSPYYQAWLGGYLVKLDSIEEWPIQKHYKLALADQKSWLKTYNDPKPYAEVDFSTEKYLGSIDISGYKGKLYQGCIWSHTDVGKRIDSWVYRQFMNGFAYVYNKCTLATQLTGDNLTPVWTPNSSLESFQKVLLEGYVAIVDISPLHKAVLYGNGCHFKDKQGKEFNTFKNISDELLHLIKQVSIVTV